MTENSRPCVITGASSGIGAACARHLGSLGYPVVLGARRVDLCEKICEEVRELGGQAQAFHLDLTSDDSIEDFVDKSAKSVGGIEIVVSCAAVVIPGTGLEMSSREFSFQVGVNLLGTQSLISRLGIPMVARQRGDIVFITSDILNSPRPQIAAYQTSKWGLEGFARALQMELEGSGVRVSVVRPGQTRTPMGGDWEEAKTAQILEEWIRFGLARHPGLLEPDSVARAVETVVSLAPGTHYPYLEIQPQAPVRRKLNA